MAAADKGQTMLRLNKGWAGAAPARRRSPIIASQHCSRPGGRAASAGANPGAVGRAWVGEWGGSALGLADVSAPCDAADSAALDVVAAGALAGVADVALATAAEAVVAAAAEGSASMGWNGG